MIHITCRRPSRVPTLPIRELLTAVGFQPRTVTDRAAYAFLYPMSAKYRKVLGRLSLVERVNEAQFLGLASQWRVRRWFGWLARALRPHLEGKKVAIHNMMHASDAVRLFLQEFSRYMVPGALVLYCDDRAFPGVEKGPLYEPEEIEVNTLLQKKPTDFTEQERDTLHDLGTGCVLSANMWHAKPIYEALCAAGDVRALHMLGMIYRFFEQPAAAEWYYQRALANENPAERMQTYYALAIVHLRAHPSHLRRFNQARAYVNAGRQLLTEHPGSREAHVYSTVMFNAVESWILHVEGKYKESLAMCDHTLTRLEGVLPTPIRDCAEIYTLSNKAQVLRSLGRLPEAREINKELTERDPMQPGWWVEYARCLVDTGQREQIPGVLDRALVMHFSDPCIYSLQAEHYARTGQHEHCVSAYERAVRCGGEEHRDALEQAQLKLKEKKKV